MAKIGEELLQPEKGWKRYDDKFPAIKYIGEWFRTNIRSYTEGTTDSSNHMSFFIIGSKLRILGAMTPSTNLFSSSNVKIEIDGVVHTFANNALAPKENSITKALLFEITLNKGVHFVKIYLNESGKKFWFDALDIDEDGRLMHPDEVTELQDLDIGKRIRCHYTPMDNQVGVFSGLGKESSRLFISPGSLFAHYGDFYFICVDKDHLGRWKLIADRNIQHSISWDTLNSAGIASGSGVPSYDLEYVNTLCKEGKPLSSGYYNNYYPQYAFEENKLNHWMSSQSGTSVKGKAWIGYDFGKAICPTAMSVMQTNPATSIKFEYSNNGSSWSLLKTLNTPNPNKDSETEYFIPITTNVAARYWRIVANSELRASYHYWSIKNFRIFDESSKIKNYNLVTRLLTGGLSSTDKDNEWDKYIVNSDLNGTIEAGDNNVWNWDDKTESWTSTSSLSSSGAFRFTRGSGGSNAPVFGRFSANSSYQKMLRPVLLIEPKNKNKSFILYENEAYYYNDGWINLGAIPDDAEAKKHLFEEYGMEHDITGQQLKELKEMLSE